MIKILAFIGFSFFYADKDSLGLETVNGKTFIIHKVNEKETLYAISRRYGTPVSSIIEVNKGTDKGLEIGQIIRVPYTPKSKPVSSTTMASTHRVAGKETLYSISKMYGITVDELKNWNNLQGNQLSVGQELIVRKATIASPHVGQSKNTENKSTKGFHTVVAGETLFAIARQYGVTTDQLREWNGLTTNDIKVGQELYITKPDLVRIAESPVVVNTPSTSATVSQPAQTPAVQSTTPQEQKSVKTETPRNEPAKEVKEQTIRISETVKGTDEVKESGLAELIEGTEGNRKYLALHRTAPKGTILKVRNEMNNREVFVRVTDKLPDTALNNKLIIKISKSAYDRLGAIDSRFRVEVTYYK